MEPKRILVVDDEPLARECVKLVLDCDLHKTETARSGLEALAKFDTQIFDVVFTDYFMPGMKGDQLAQRIKQRNHSLPVVLLTAFPPREKCAEFDCVVLKPCSQDSLRKAIETVLDLKRP